MSSQMNKPIPPGWTGGFAESNPKFAYPNPNLSSLPLLDNLANIDLLERQQSVKWPEFSWETMPGKKDSRCFQMFAPYISRLGYTHEGRVYSIICPQQGFCSPSLGCLNVEVTVTGQRGWTNEDTRELAADLTAEVKIWFSPSAKANPIVKLLWRMFKSNKLHFPSQKSKAIVVKTHMPYNPDKPEFLVRNGEAKFFKSPEFARHPEAWTVGNVEVNICDVVKTGHPVVDEFNQLVVDAFNLTSGNMLKKDNLLSWNVWFTAPELVDQEEWKDHAEKWRKSIDADHGSPDGEGTLPRYFDGKHFEPEEGLLDREVENIFNFLRKHL